MVPRSIAHVAACLLARVDGKSPVEYLDALGQEVARNVAIEALESLTANLGRNAPLTGDATRSLTLKPHLREGTES